MGNTAGFIIGISGSYQGMEIPVGDGIVIGRDPSESQVVIDDSNISRRHCRITFDKTTGDYYIEDFNSTNGVFLANGTRIPAGRQVKVSGGEAIKVGNGDAKFRLSAGNSTVKGNVAYSNAMPQKAPAGVALACGIISLVLTALSLFFGALGLFTCLLGLILGIVGLALSSKTKKLTNNEKGKGAFVCSLLGVIFGALVIIPITLFSVGIGGLLAMLG